MQPMRNSIEIFPFKMEVAPTATKCHDMTFAVTVQKLVQTGNPFTFENLQFNEF